VPETERNLEAWGTSAPGPYVTIRTGGPLGGLVTLTAVRPEGRVIVEATWGTPHARSSITAERIGHGRADELAQQWANELAVGHEPRANQDG